MLYLRYMIYQVVNEFIFTGLHAYYRNRVIELQERRSALKCQLQLIKEAGGLAEELDAVQIEEDISKLAVDIADLQDFLDYYQQFQD